MEYTQAEIDEAVRQYSDDKDRQAHVASIMHQVVGAEDEHPYSHRLRR